MVFIGTSAWLRVARGPAQALAQVAPDVALDDPRVFIRPASRGEIARLGPAALKRVDEVLA